MNREPRGRCIGFGVAIVFLSLAFQSCLASEPFAPWPKAVAKPWTEADQLFHRDARWRGGDGASSVDLGNERVLWLFGDSFVSNQPASHRRDTRLVNNSLGIQRGLNPTTATFKCYWNEKQAQPEAYFETADSTWYWPASGVVLNDKLLILLMRIERADEGMGFRVVGNGGYLVRNPQDSPDKWQMDPVRLPEYRFKVLYGTGGMAIEGDYLHAISPVVSKGHNGYLMRWNLTDVREGDLTNPEWHDGSQWVAHETLEALPKETLPRAQTEFTVHRCQSRDILLQVQCSPYLAAQVGVRYSSRWEGPWSAMQYVYDPRTRGDLPPGIFFYSGKAHPELIADGLATTYCCNLRSLAEVVNNETIYYPRFVKITFED